MKYKLGDNVLIYKNFNEIIKSNNFGSYFNTYHTDYNTKIKYIIDVVNEKSDFLIYYFLNNISGEKFWIPEELIYSLQEERLKKLERLLNDD